MLLHRSLTLFVYVSLSLSRSPPRSLALDQLYPNSITLITPSPAPLALQLIALTE